MTVRTDRSDATVTRTSAAGRITHVDVDGLGRAESVAFAGRAALSQSYDIDGRLIASGLGARVSSFGYDGSDRVASVTDPLGVTQKATYDAAGRTKTVSWPGLAVTFGYDAAGHVSSVTPSGRTATLLHLNAAGDLDAYTPPALSTGPTNPLRIAYDSAGRISRIINPDGATIDMHVVATSPDVTVTTSIADTLVFRHSATTLNPTSATYNRGASLAYTYDGKLPTGSTWSGPVQGSLSYAYDADFRLSQEKVNGASAIAFSYDADNLLTQAGALSLTRSASDGAVTTTTLAGATTVTAYSQQGEIDSTSMTVSGSRVYAARYTVDANGRITSRTETVNAAATTFTYAYDSLSRLTDVSQDGVASEHLDYDIAGNIVRRTTSTGIVTATVDEQDRLLTHGAFAFRYSANGEMIRKAAGADTTTLSYSAFGQLEAVRLGDGTRIDYVLDADSRRVAKRVNGALVRGWLYRDKLRIVAELDGASALVSRFVYGPQTTAPQYMIRNGTTYRFVLDERGSVLAVVDATTGAIAQRLTYDVLGRVSSNSNPDFQPFGFAGGLYDQHTGLTHFGARDYDASVGRWTRRDPSLFQGRDFNLYRYANGDPVNLTDPTGEFTKAEQTQAMELEDELNVAEEKGVQTEIRDVKERMCSLSARLVNVYGRMKSLGGNWENHHILQNAAMKGMANYSSYRGIALPLYGGNRLRGSPHHLSNNMQKSMLGQPADEVAKAALKAAGCKPEDVDTIMKAVDQWIEDGMTIPLP